jgi:ribosomal protein L37AE/L43A
MKSISCPFCQGELKEKKINKFTINTCSACSLFLIDYQQLLRLNKERCIEKDKLNEAIITLQDTIKSKEVCPNCRKNSLLLDKGRHFGYCEKCDHIIIKKSKVNELSKFKSKDDLFGVLIDNLVFNLLGLPFEIISKL